MVKQLLLEMFDAYGNHVSKGLEVQLDVDGFHMLDQTDQIGRKRKVDDNGCIDLGGLLKVIAGFGSKASLSVLSGHEVVFKQELQIENRELRIASRVPEFCTAGSELENIIFDIVNSEGDVDETIHDEDNICQSKLLSHKRGTDELDIKHESLCGGCPLQSFKRILLPGATKLFLGRYSWPGCTSGYSSHQEVSRILAEYLGEDQMLAVVCRSFVAATALENYEQNGEVDCGQALHAAAAAHRNSINSQFLVMCLEDLRPNTGKYEGSDPQRKLASPYPTLPRGNVPRGFIGDPRICFPVVTPDSESESSAGNVEVMKLIEEKKELEVITSSIGKMTKSQEKCLKKFKKKKEKFDKFMDNMEPVLKDYYLEYNTKSKSDNSPG